MPITITPYIAANNFDMSSPALADNVAGGSELVRLSTTAKRGILMCEGLVTVAALTGLRVTQAALTGANVRTLIEDAGFNAWKLEKTGRLLETLGGPTEDGWDIHQTTTAVGWFQFVMRVWAATEISIWARSGGTGLVRLRGRVFDAT